MTRFPMVIVAAAIVSVLAILAVGQVEPPPNAYRTAAELAAKNPELFKRMTQQSREAERLKRAATYDPKNDPTYTHRLPIDVAELSKEGVPAAFLLETRQWAPIEPECTSETSWATSAWVRTDDSITRLAIACRPITSPSEAMQEVANGSAAIYKPQPRDEFGAGQSTLSCPDLDFTATTFVAYESWMVSARMSAALNLREESFRAEIGDADRELIWNLARRTLGYQVAKSLIADGGQRLNTPSGPVAFRKTSSIDHWTLEQSSAIGRTYIVDGKKIELVAGACRAKVNGELVQLKHIVAANDHDWFISNEDADLLTR